MKDVKLQSIDQSSIDQSSIDQSSIDQSSIDKSEKVGVWICDNSKNPQSILNRDTKNSSTLFLVKKKKTHTFQNYLILFEINLIIFHKLLWT